MPRDDGASAHQLVIRPCYEPSPGSGSRRLVWGWLALEGVVVDNPVLVRGGGRRPCACLMLGGKVGAGSPLRPAKGLRFGNRAPLSHSCANVTATVDWAGCVIPSRCLSGSDVETGDSSCGRVVKSGSWFFFFPLVFLVGAFALQGVQSMVDVSDRQRLQRKVRTCS